MANEQPKITSELAIFSDLTAAELTIVDAIVDYRKYDADTTVFAEGEPGGEVFIVLSGAVAVSARITADVDKTLVTVRAGGVFGELSLLQDEFRNATARTVECTRVATINQAKFLGLLESEPAIVTKVLKFLVNTTAQRLRYTTELYRQATEWGLDISGVVELNYSQLIASEVELTIQLVTGDTITGILLKVEKGVPGMELLLKDGSGAFSVIPYHAVARITFSPVVISTPT